jgi:uncharacterized membrane protein
MTRRWLVWLEWLGKHSLAIYVIHLFLLFTILPFGESLVVHFGHSLDQTGLFLVATALLAATVSVVAVWQRIKRMTGLGYQG